MLHRVPLLLVGTLVGVQARDIPVPLAGAGNAVLARALLVRFYGYRARVCKRRMQNSTKKTCLGRLARIEGQIRGISRMVTEDRYCIDVINQIQAVRAATKKVEDEILKDHVATCVEEAIRSCDARDQRKKVAELLNVLAHLAR
jgi:CsoR family transcriptional regulator, copper-sensing transcriptional repressor